MKFQRRIHDVGKHRAAEARSEERKAKIIASKPKFTIIDARTR